MGMIIVIAGAIVACACIVGIGIYCYRNLAKKAVVPAPGNSAGGFPQGDEIDLEDGVHLDAEGF